MSEPILNALMQLFALIGDIHDTTVITNREKDIVRSFLTRHLNNELITRYMKIYEEYLELFISEKIAKDTVRDRKRTSLNVMRILAICENINKELQQKQKTYLLIQLLDYISLGEEVTENELDFLKTVATSFYIPEAEYEDLRSFIIDKSYNIREKRRVLIIDNNNEPDLEGIKHSFNKHLRGILLFLHIPSSNTFILRYSGDSDLYLNGQNILVGQTYIFDHGSVIRSTGIDTIYYTEVVSLITEATYESKISLVASDVSFNFRKSDNGVHNLNFCEESGKLIGIIGGSGVGKSTTLSIMNGTLEPHSGEVLINGYNLYDEIDKEYLQGVIGFVPQDDLLIDELTVYQNLYFNAKMCLNKLSQTQLTETVVRTLMSLDLYEIKDLKVGNPLSKIISGGQRKRVNIALELIREPTILFVDEPTSGLSSVDSEIVMSLLKEQTYKGKLVIINIHQPCSEIYKMFDKIMIIDKGGYQVYLGNPSEAIVYFKTHSNHANPSEDQCIKCGTVNTDQILQIIEAKVIDERGRPTRLRKVSPIEWAEKFSENKRWNKAGIPREKQKLPENCYSIPGLFKQSLIFINRDILSKLSDKQYILINLFGPPLLAFLLAYFTRSVFGSTYLFSENENIPAYLFMCVITSLFFGLMISSEEIVKDRKILKRESFLNLSWFSYLNSKVIIMFLISAVQALLFVLIGNLILEIKGATLSYWIVLFTTSCLANLLGLNISSAFNSVITIYILIPFILIPQLLFSGVLVKFDKLHKGRFSSYEYVPVIGDVMAARWAFEALAVEQFKNNKYERNFIYSNIEKSQNDWYANYLIPALRKDLWECEHFKDSIGYQEQITGNFTKLNYYIDKLTLLAGFDRISGGWKDSLNKDHFNSEVAKQTAIYLDSLAGHFRYLRNKYLASQDSVSASIVSETGKEEFIKLKEDNVNTSLEDLVLSRTSIRDKTFETDTRIIQKFEPAYMKPYSKYGRTHFYAPYKLIGNLKIDTFWFNIFILWFATLILYIVLYFNGMRKALGLFDNLRFKKSNRKASS